MAPPGATRLRPTAGRAGRRRRWATLALAAALLVLYILNLPLYAGGAIGRGMRWRLEHGRVMVERGPTASDGPFWIAPNTEGLRFLPSWRFRSRRDWLVGVPLWMPLAIAAAWGVWAWWPRRTPPGGCPRCGYAAAGLSVCPECGQRQRTGLADDSGGGRP